MYKVIGQNASLPQPPPAKSLHFAVGRLMSCLNCQQMFSRWGSLDPYVMQDSLCPRVRCKLPAQQFCTGHHCAAQHADHATATFVAIGRIYAVRTMTPNNSESLQRRTWLHSKWDYSNQPLDQSVHVLDRPSAGF